MKKHPSKTLKCIGDIKIFEPIAIESSIGGYLYYALRESVSLWLTLY